MRHLYALSCLLFACALGCARADEAPLRLIVPLPPGSATSVAADIIVPPLSQALGKRFEISYIAHLNGVFGTREVAIEPKKDGSTLLLGTAGPLSMLFAQERKMPPYALDDFQPITMWGTFCIGLATAASFPANSLPEFIEYARTHTVRFGLGGFFSQILGEQFERAANLRFEKFFSGSPPAVMNLIAAGQLDATITTIGTMEKHLKAGNIKVLGVMDKRCGLPDRVMRFADAGVPMPQITLWAGLLAPRGVPASVVERVGSAAREILARPEIVAKLRTDAGLEAHTSEPEQFAAFLREQVKTWQSIVLPQERR